MKMEQKECSETSAYKIQVPGNYPEEGIQHSEHGESLKLNSKSVEMSLKFNFELHFLIVRTEMLFFSHNAHYADNTYVNFMFC